MSSSRVPPDSDSGLLDWASSFSSYVQAHFAALEVSSDTASDLTAKFNAYQGALENSNNPETRGPAKVLQKNLRKSELLELCRPLAVQINANPNVTDEQRQALGLKIRDRHPTPSPVPTTPPKVGIVNFGGNTLKVTLSDQDVLKRGKPPHVTGAAIYFWVGEETPTENTPWIAFANTGRTMFNMEFPSSLPAGTKVWIIAAWSNSRGQFGPSCQPISALLLGQMEFQQGNLKLAA